MPIVRHTPVPLSTRGPLYGEEFNAAHTGTNQNGERDEVVDNGDGLRGRYYEDTGSRG
ncbi:hypothetical protein L917_10036 [Phytophthora nicotianae]|uniref:Uncharacterized protein n=1 Tax=Phytophthora nicotianae TaxID=4792 RepID=W2L223_PHYNI|nr:hypothetical protein L917_10036 [Phytophthora nicotianae]